MGEGFLMAWGDGVQDSSAILFDDKEGTRNCDSKVTHWQPVCSTSHCSIIYYQVHSKCTFLKFLA